MADLKKPLTRVVRGAGQGVHGISDDIIVTLYPNGTIELREPRRKQRYHTSLGSVMTRAIEAEVNERHSKPRPKLARRGLLRRA